jgi:FKBP-type peptidyl-prolyl cis-trans isomerase
MTINGEKQFSFDAKQQTYRMEQQDIISGLREGFKLMSEGDIITFIFPSYLAYGLYGDSEKKIKPNTTLVYEVNVHKILKNNL